LWLKKKNIIHKLWSSYWPTSTSCEWFPDGFVLQESLSLLADHWLYLHHSLVKSQPGFDIDLCPPPRKSYFLWEPLPIQESSQVLDHKFKQFNTWLRTRQTCSSHHPAALFQKMHEWPSMVSGSAAVVPKETPPLILSGTCWVGSTAAR
jgi:hypothetical protein